MPIHEKLIIVQSELKAPKSKTNSFAKYKYRSCEDILEAVKPLLKEQGLILTISDEIVQIGTRYYVKATAMVTDGENALPVSAFAREPEEKKGSDESQITGAASSYARKHALNGLFLIDDTQDADTMDNTKPAKKPAAYVQPNPMLPNVPSFPKFASTDQQGDIINKARSLNLDVQKDIYEPMKIVGLPTAEQATKIIQRLNDKLAEAVS